MEWNIYRLKCCTCIDYVGAEVCANEKVTLAMYEDIASDAKYIEWHLHQDPPIVIPWEDAPQELKCIWWVLKMHGAGIVFSMDSPLVFLEGPHLLREMGNYVLEQWQNPGEVPLGKMRVLNVPPQDRMEPNNINWVYNVIGLNSVHDSSLRQRCLVKKAWTIWKQVILARREKRYNEIQRIVWDKWMERALRPTYGKLYKYYEARFNKNIRALVGKEFA